jgi:hypothetical protein
MVYVYKSPVFVNEQGFCVCNLIVDILFASSSFLTNFFHRHFLRFGKPFLGFIHKNGHASHSPTIFGLSMRNNQKKYIS